MKTKDYYRCFELCQKYYNEKRKKSETAAEEAAAEFEKILSSYSIPEFDLPTNLVLPDHEREGALKKHLELYGVSVCAIDFPKVFSQFFSKDTNFKVPLKPSFIIKVVLGITGAAGLLCLTLGIIGLATGFIPLAAVATAASTAAIYYLAVGAGLTLFSGLAAGKMIHDKYSKEPAIGIAPKLQ